MTYLPQAAARPDRYTVHVEQYAHYHRYGYLKVESLIPQEQIKEWATWADDILYGRTNLPGVDPVEPGASLETMLQRFTRIHMLHRVNATAEQGLLHPRILDVIEALIGPDVLALQSMLFFNPPGQGGQGWHQDSYYIPTYPDSMVGAWVALEAADEDNGCLWVVPGSNHEPVYPPVSAPYSVHAAGAFEGLSQIEGASDLDDSRNTLSRVVAKYPAPISVPMQPGDVLFFHSHLLHRSYPNRTTDRFRRSYVCHYCNARSWVPWNHGAPFDGDAANNLHILARGTTHLPYSQPAFGTPVELYVPEEADGGAPAPRMMGMEDKGTMEVRQETKGVHVE